MYLCSLLLQLSSTVSPVSTSLQREVFNIPTPFKLGSCWVGNPYMSWPGGEHQHSYSCQLLFSQASHGCKTISHSLALISTHQTLLWLGWRAGWPQERTQWWLSPQPTCPSDRLVRSPPGMRCPDNTFVFFRKLWISWRDTIYAKKIFGKHRVHAILFLYLYYVSQKYYLFLFPHAVLV